MHIIEALDSHLKKASQASQKPRQKKIELYVHGMKSKIRQADFALSQLRNLSSRSDKTESTTEPTEFYIEEMVRFYCDSFWAFLYSSLDVLGHVINCSQNLKMDEKEVSFTKVGTRLAELYPGKALHKKVKACIKSKPFNNLADYRNCSIHRRAIYIHETINTVESRGTPGYSITTTHSKQSIIKRLICENPLQLKPQLKQNRAIPQFLDDTQAKILNHIVEIFKSLSVVP